MIEQGMHGLWTQTVVLSVATLLVAALRGATARRFGAEAAYLAWALVPTALLAAALPHPARGAIALPAAIARLVPAWQDAMPAAPAPGVAWSVLLSSVWIVGATALVVAMALRQRRFLGQLSPSDELPAGCGPAVVGIVQARVVLPADFEQRFDAEERGMMLAHESVHLRRRDNAWNLLACTIVVVHWFNPLAWLAWRWMRFDQELSCDAAALRSDAHARRVHVYANALLKVQGVSLRPPFATSWRSTHPLVERIRMLNRHSLSAGSRRSGRCLAVLAAILAGAVSYAAQPPAKEAFGRYTTLVDDGRTSTEVTFAVDGQPPRRVSMAFPTQVGYVRFQPQPSVGLPDWLSVRLSTKLLDDGSVAISSVLRDETADKELGKPVVVMRMNEPGRIEVGGVGGTHVVTLTYIPRATGYEVPGADHPLPAPPAAPVAADLPALPAPPAPRTLPAPPAADLPAPPAPPQRAL